MLAHVEILSEYHNNQIDLQILIHFLPGKGLTLVGSVIEGDYSEKFADALAAKQTLSQMMKKEKARGFAEVIVADNMIQGLCYLFVFF